MRASPRLPYWTVLGLDLTLVALACVALVWRMHRAYETDDLSRETLVRLLLVGLTLLGLLLTAGWAYVSQPGPQKPRRDPLWD